MVETKEDGKNVGRKLRLSTPRTLRRPEQRVKKAKDYHIEETKHEG